MFVQPSLGPSSLSSVQRSIDFEQVLEGEKVTLPVEWGRLGQRVTLQPSPFSSKIAPLCSPLSLIQSLTQKKPYKVPTMCYHQDKQ